MSPDRDAPTGPTRIALEKQGDSLNERRAVFHNGKEPEGKTREKAGNWGIRLVSV
jgi:hypothetical protein